MENLILLSVIGLVINGIISNIVGNTGKRKDVGYNKSFWVSFFLSPIIGLLLVIASTPITEEEIERREKTNKPWYDIFMEKSKKD
jgi:hypothetical protein